MKYEITPAMGALAQSLFEAGYTGDISLSNTGCTGTQEMFGGSFIAMELTGFCKETLFIAWNTFKDEYVLIGRYDVLEHTKEIPSVEDLTRLAWSTYKGYKKSKNWGRPTEWDALFKQFGLITTRMVEKTIEIESD